MRSNSLQEYQATAIVLLLSVFALLPSWYHYDIISNDGAFQYIPVAELFLQGKFREAFLTPQLPLFPLLIAGVSTLTGMDPELSGRLIAATAFVIAALGLYRLSMFLFKQRWVAILAVLFMITNRDLVDNSVDCLKESLLVALMLWGNYLNLQWINQRQPWRLIAGILLLLLGGLLRSAALFFVGAWLILWVFHKRQGMALRLGLIVSPVVIVLILWLIDPKLPIFIRSYNLALIFKPKHNTLFLLRAAGRTIRDFFLTGNPVIILFACAGFYQHRKNLYALHAAIVLAIYLLILVMWGSASDRYLLAPIVWVYPLAASTVIAAMQSSRVIWKASAVITMLSSLVLWGHLSLTPPDQDRLARKEAGQWILAHIGSNQEIMTNRERLAFYAKGRLIPLACIDLNGPHSCIAVDTILEQGRTFKVRIDRAGVRSDAVFRTIYVYLPRP